MVHGETKAPPPPPVTRTDAEDGKTKPVGWACSLPSTLPPPVARTRSRAPTPLERFALDAGESRPEYHAVVYAHLAAAPWSVSDETVLDLAQLVSDIQGATGHKRADVQAGLRHLPLFLSLHGFSVARVPGDAAKLRVVRAVPALVLT